MRTTITIDDRLLVEAKTRAIESGTTLGGFIEDALRQALARRSGVTRPAGPALPVHHGSRLAPGVDLDDTAALLALMEEGTP